MTTDNPQDKTDGKSDLSVSIDAINKSVQEKLKEGFNDLASHIDKKLETTKPEKNDGFDDDSPEDDGDEDSYITKKYLKRFTKSLVEDLNKTTKRTVDETIESKKSKSSRDAEAAEDFPLLNNKSKEFNATFYKEVGAEVGRKVKNGRFKDDPDLIYDAAAAVEKRWVNEGKYIPKALADRLNQDRNNMDDSFDVSTTSNREGAAPTARQIELARRVGLSKDRLTQHMKKTW